MTGSNLTDAAPPRRARSDRRADSRDGTLLVAAAAALWGLDGLLRKPLATAMNASTVVLWEHVIAVVVLLPGIPAAARSFRTASWRDRAAVVAVGVGASAVATALFTEAFTVSARTQDYITPLVLQKLQPLFAITLAMVFLRERPRPAYLFYVLPALAGAWLLTFANPVHVRAEELQPALLAAGAALLWAAGTVLGRHLASASMRPGDVTTLRYTFGLVGAIAVVRIVGAPTAPGWANLPGLVLLALIPGLVALVIYYRALQHTPATRATLAELAFPTTAAFVGVVFLHGHLTGSQWFGLMLTSAAIAALGWHEAGRSPAIAPPRNEVTHS